MRTFMITTILRAAVVSSALNLWKNKQYEQKGTFSYISVKNGDTEQ